jgi:hypothetical protein
MRPIEGVYEQTPEKELNWEVHDTSRKTLGGRWISVTEIWVKRREAILDYLERAQPFLFRPVIQIDPINARPLVDALGARWNYDKERRDTRDAAWHIANAFGILLTRLKLKVQSNAQKPPRLPPSWMSA